MNYRFVLSPGLSRTIQAARNFRYQFDRVNGHKKFYFFSERLLPQRRDFRIAPRGLHQHNYQLPTDVYVVSHQSDVVNSNNYDFDFVEGKFALEYEGLNVFKVLDHPPEDENTPWVTFISQDNN